MDRLKRISQQLANLAETLRVLVSDNQTIISDLSERSRSEIINSANKSLDILANPQLANATPRSQTEIDRLTSNNICLWCEKGIGKKKKTRGCHQACYNTVHSRGQIEIAVALGRMLPRGKPGAKPKNTLEDFILKKKRRNRRG